MNIKKILESKENEQFKTGFCYGKQLAEKMQKEDPEKYARIKVAFEKIMKGEKNVNF